MTNPNPQQDPYRSPGQPGEYDQAYQNPPTDQPYGQQAPYQQPYYQESQAYYYTPVAPPTDGFSVAALVLGILGFNIFAIVFGIIGLNRTSTGQYSGRGMAIAGIVLGALSLIALIFIFVFFVALVGAVA